MEAAEHGLCEPTRLSLARADAAEDFHKKPGTSAEKNATATVSGRDIQRGPEFPTQKYLLPVQESVAQISVE